MKFSVVTPSFNQLEWLRLCAASVADQAGAKIQVEHIVQDAGSGSSLKEWALTQPASLRLFVEKDDGMYDAVNRGLRRATGDFCAYLNCDEQYLPGALLAVTQFFETNPEVDVLFGDALLLDTRSQPLAYRRAIPPRALHTRLAHLSTLTCATFFRRSVVERGFLFPEEWKAIGDGVWVLRLLEAKVRMAVLPKALAAFAFTGSNLGQSERAIEETREWRQNMRWHGTLRPLSIILHRWRKLVAGAYRRRTFTTELYALEDPNRRQVFNARRLGWSWPRQEK